MQSPLNEEHQQIHLRVRAYMQAAPGASDDRLERQPIMPHTVLPGMAAAGLLALSIPEQYGGIGGDHVSLGFAAEELEAYDTAPREVLTAHTAMCGLSLLQWGTEAQKSRFLAPQSNGARIGSAALDILVEDSAGFSTPFTARRQRDGAGTTYLLNGSHPGVRLAMVADHVLVIARLIDTGDFAAFIVERELAGVDADDSAEAAGTGIPLRGSLSLQDVRVHESCRLGAEGEGEAIARYAVNAGRYTVAAGAIGIIKRCINLSLACVDRQTDRKAQYARFSPLIAQMFRRIEMVRRMLNEALAQAQNSDEASRALSLALWFANSAVYDSLADATQIQSVCAADAQLASVR